MNTLYIIILVKPNHLIKYSNTLVILLYITIYYYIYSKLLESACKFRHYEDFLVLSRLVIKYVQYATISGSIGNKVINNNCQLKF